MKQLFSALIYLSFSSSLFAQVSEPEKIIRLAPDAHFITELNLDHDKEYGFLAKDIQELFPTLVKEKRANERFGKNAYRTKVTKVIDEKALVPAMATSIRKQRVEIQNLKNKLITIEKGL